MAGDGHRTLLVDRNAPHDALAALLGVSDGAVQLALASAAPLPVTDTLWFFPAGATPNAGRYAEFDAVIVDAGSRLTSIEQAAASAAGRFVVIAGTRAPSLASAYALLKTVHTRWPSSPVELLINRHDALAAQEAFHQVQRAADSFLDREVHLAGTIPEDDGLRSGVLAGRSLAQLAARTRAGHAAQVVAARLIDEMVGVAPFSASRMTERRH
jgi:MinD-like ATPase involved in chromosome partitioning or flagellar assembly